MWRPRIRVKGTTCAQSLQTTINTQMNTLSSQTKVVASSDGASIFASAYGRISNPAIVVIHGIILSGDVFENLATDPRLSDNFYLICYDMRGHGKSSKPTEPESYSSKLYADDFAAICKAFNIEKPFLFGWSLGGGLVHYRPSQPCNLIAALLAAFHTSAPSSKKIGLPLIAALNPGFLCMDDVDLSRDTMIRFVDSLFRDPALAPMQLKFRLLGITVMQPASVTRLVLSRTQDPTRLFEVAKAGLPVLLLSGTEDLLISGAAVEEELKPHFSNFAVKMVEGGAHALFYEHKDEVISAITDFVTSSL
ncbi:alpha/beta-hydrolase [Mycena olivaceomarginata]|nr:alpha/beta-hydrolase [Mycena olivaceomarginata]